MTQAALGGKINIKSLDEKTLKLKIPAGTQNGKLLRIRGEGVPSGIGRKGDLYIQIQVQIPRSKLIIFPIFQTSSGWPRSCTSAAPHRTKPE